VLISKAPAARCIDYMDFKETTELLNYELKIFQWGTDNYTIRIIYCAPNKK
jgi:hypothetical protein